MAIFTPWIVSLDEATRKRVFAAMREIGARCLAEWDKAHELAPKPGEAAVGGQDLDHVLRASVGDHYLTELRNGAKPEGARIAAEAEMASLVNGMNRKLAGSRGFATPRSATAETDFLNAIHRQVLAAVEAPEAEAAKVA